jgi:DnaK suppressor protein
MTPAETPLTDTQIEELREELERTLARIERSLKLNGGGNTNEIDQSAVGRLSRIEAIQNQGLTRNLRDRERHQLEQVVEALKRLDDGTYGLCTSCRGAIQHERLLVFPEASTCTACTGGS